ncbi:MAG: Gfo/Idh/MocA family protein [Alphaproteobacteria bacterium]
MISKDDATPKSSVSASGGARLRVGVAGLGVASSQILPSLKPGGPFELVAGADTRRDAREAFSAAYDRPAVASVEELCAREDIDVVWISTPNTLHAEHTVAATRAGKHVICEKPMAVTLAECDLMISSAAENGVLLLQGHSKIYQAPMRMMRDVLKSGRLGRVIQIQSANSNDWLQRPRLAAELDTRLGGGIVYRQGPHMVDIVRFLAGGMTRRVIGVAGKADPHFDAFGHFSALLDFEGGAAATLTFNGYGYFDIAELTWDIGESGYLQTGGRRFPGKPRLTGAADPHGKSEGAEARKVTPEERNNSHRHPPFFGLTIVHCERGAMRQSPKGLFVYTETGIEEIVCPPRGGRTEELTELADALANGRAAFPDGRWGKATLEVCLEIMASAGDGQPRDLRYQVAAP